MKIDHITKQSLTDLAKLVLANKSSGVGILKWPFKFAKIPDDVDHDGIDGDSLITCAEDYEQYMKCLSLLTDVKSLEHISYREMDKELWHFFCEIFCDPAITVSDSRISAAVNALLERLNKPLIEYEVLISLDKHLVLNGHSIELAGVRFVEMNEADLLDWGINNDVSVSHKYFHEAVVGHAAALMLEQCHGSDKAVENAKIKLSIALDALRVALFMDHDPRLVDWRIHDHQVLFRAGEEIAVRQKGNSTAASFMFHSGFRSADFRVDEVYLNQIVESKRVIDLLFLPDNPQRKIFGRMRRALQWIGGSATREGLDDKVVDICTALETLLTTQRDRLKGEAICRRSMLLYSLSGKQPNFDPVTLLRLYRQRSWVIHGSYKDICSDFDYKLGQLMAIDIFKNVLAYICAHNIIEHSAFIKDLESDPMLVKHCNEIIGPASKALKSRPRRASS